MTARRPNESEVPAPRSTADAPRVPTAPRLPSDLAQLLDDTRDTDPAELAPESAWS